MIETTLTSAQRAGKTNHERSERRKEALRKEQEETKLLRDQMNAVLKSPDATHGEKVRAAEVLTQIRKGSF